jgi:ADP-ribose pyrophosphatase YjhB (NUDIX family)
LQAIAQTGLAFVRDPYDRQRYEVLRGLASQIMAGDSAMPDDRIETCSATSRAIPRPKWMSGARSSTLTPAFSWCVRLPMRGGWADVNLMPAENVVREVREESGYDVRVRKLAAPWDRARQAHPPSVFSCCKLFYVGDLMSGYEGLELKTAGRRDGARPVIQEKPIWKPSLGCSSTPDTPRSFYVNSASLRHWSEDVGAYAANPVRGSLISRTPSARLSPMSARRQRLDPAGPDLIHDRLGRQAHQSSRRDIRWVMRTPGDLDRPN